MFTLPLVELVALLAEGGDRNPEICASYFFPGLSPSSRRAGIEIASDVRFDTCCDVSPSSRRAGIEIVRQFIECGPGESPSSRRAGIEIPSHRFRRR